MHGCGQLIWQKSLQGWTLAMICLAVFLRTGGIWSTKADIVSRPYSKRPLSVLSVCFRLCHGTLPSCSIKDAMKMNLQDTHRHTCRAATCRLCDNAWVQKQHEPTGRERSPSACP